MIYVEIGLTSWDVKAIRDAFDIPGGVSNETLADALVNDLIDRYFGPPYWCQKDIDQLVSAAVDGE